MAKNQAIPDRHEVAAGRGAVRRDPSTELSQLRREHPQYEIRLMTAQVWEAVSHPGPGRTVVHCAGSLGELRAKIEGDAR